MKETTSSKGWCRSLTEQSGSRFSHRTVSVCSWLGPRHERAPTPLLHHDGKVRAGLPDLIALLTIPPPSKHVLSCWQGSWYLYHVYNL
jgi:hypothetical protein